MAEIHYSMLQGENSDGASWIGGTDQVKKGYWQWTDCSPWNFAAWSEPTLPDHRQIEQSCAAIFRKEGKDNWNYHPCNDAYILKFVCRRHICSGKALIRITNNQDIADIGDKSTRTDITTILVGSITGIIGLVFIGVILFLVIRCQTLE